MAEAAFIAEALGKAPCVVFSKTTCPFCDQTKAMLDGLTLPVKYHVVELNTLDNMSALQDELKSITGGRSVPRVFVGGKFLGGNDDTLAANASGALDAQLKAAGAYGAAAGGSDEESTMVLLEQLPANTAHTLAYQLKEALSLDATPMVLKISDSSAICYLGSVTDAAKASASGSVTLFQVSVSIKPYSDGSIPLAAPAVSRPMTPAVKPAAKAAGG